MPNLKYSIEPPRYNLPAATQVNFGFSATCQAAQVFAMPESPARIYGTWNTQSVGNQIFDFFLDAGDAVQSPDFAAVSMVALLTSTGQTYATHFTIKGY